MRGFELLLSWCLLFTSHQYYWSASGQFFDSASEYNHNNNNNNPNQKRIQAPYNIFSNQSLSERTAFQDKYNREYELNSNSQTDGSNYYSNTTYRTRGNSSVFIDPLITTINHNHNTNTNNHNSDTDTVDRFHINTNNDHDVDADDDGIINRPLEKLTALGVDGVVDTRRLQSYGNGRSYPDNFFDSNTNSGQFNVNNNNNNYNYNNNNNNNNNNYNNNNFTPQGPQHRSYEESFKDRSYDQRERERDSGRKADDYSVTSRNTNTNTNYNSNNNNVHNSNYPGAGSSYYSDSSNRNINFNSNSNQPIRPEFGPGSGSYGGNIENSNRGRTYAGYPGQNANTPYPGSPGSNINPNNYNRPGAGAFDPGYPYKNIWNEHWSTTTDRPTAPGVLGKWRPDLQGQQRPEDIHQIPTAVYVTTAYGRVQGFKVKLYDGPWVPLPARPGIANVDKVQKTVSSFVGIPYARSPVQDGRFRPPRPHTGWQLLQAVEFGPACPQPSRFFGYTAGIVTVDEDCLYLNVFSPDVGAGAKGAPFPVIFYIHDGDFTHGASNQFPPHQLVAYYDLVVVTVNFRLGAIGFLSTADEHSPGNYGMLDLSLALKWVHTNIRSFNGDPDRITLVGLGSGAAAAGLLMLSPRSRSYVKNVIALEGAPTADWAAIVDKYRLQNTTELFSMKLGCWQQYEQASWKTVQCLRSRSWQELANVELEPDVGTFPWSPAVDKEFRVPKDDYMNDWKEEDWKFLPDDPLNLLKHGEYPYVKYMTGFARQSAADLLYANKTLAPNYVVTREWFDQMIHRWVKKYNYTLNPESVFHAIRYAYTYWPDPQNTTHLREEYINFLSDALYRSPIDQTVKLLLARGIQVHSYLLNYTLEGLRLPFWREVPRGMEYYLMSGAPFMDPEFYPERLRVDRFAWTEGDRNMSNFFMSSVANMAHFGHPTPHEVLGIYWERATPADLKYLALNATINSTMQRNYRQRELTFWTEYMPSVVGRLYNTYPPTTEYWWEPNEPLQIAFWTVSGICLILIVILVACFLLWRTAKKQRDRIYDDLGLVNGPPLGIGTIVGDEISEYAETVKTADSMDSGVKLTTHHHHPQHHPNSSSQNSTNVTLHQMYPTPPVHHHPGGSVSGHRERDRFPTPKRNLRDRDTPQTQV